MQVLGPYYSDESGEKMIRKIPIIRPDISASDIIRGFKSLCAGSSSEEFIAVLSGFTRAKFICTVNSGLAAFYILLKALQEKSFKKEVVLPAYTAGSLITAVRKAGLKPVLCDISLKDFNMDKDVLSGALSGDTLAVVAVHMFGIPVRDIAGFRAMIPEGTWFLEDCAQAMGSKVSGLPVGCFSDAGFFSFNRGKNLSVFSGGCICTNNEDIAAGVRSAVRGLRKAGPLSGSLLLFKTAALVLATNPMVYGLGYPFISRFKDIAPAMDLSARPLSDFQAGLGSVLLEGCREDFSARHKNGAFIIEGLRGNDGVILPDISGRIYAVFNRLPLLFRDARLLERKQRELWDAGIESSRMYDMPLHHMFELGYKKEDFPNADYLAGHLLTLPVYPLLKKQYLEKMIEVIRK